MGMRVEEGVADHQLVAPHRKKYLLLEKHAAHPVGDDREGVHFEIHDILVAAGLIDIPVAVDPEVEWHPVLQEGLVEGRQQHVTVPVETVDRNCEQTVIFARIATHDGGVAISARPVGREQLPLEGVFQVHELSLVELQISHCFIRTV